MGWLRVLDIPFDILASLLYRSTRHSLPGRTNMAPPAPQVRRGQKTHATTTRDSTHSTDHSMRRAGPQGPCGEAGSFGAPAAALGSTPAAALVLLGHAALGRVEGKCCPSVWSFSASQKAIPTASS